MDDEPIEVPSFVLPGSARRSAGSDGHWDNAASQRMQSVERDGSTYVRGARRPAAAPLPMGRERQPDRAAGRAAVGSSRPTHLVRWVAALLVGVVAVIGLAASGAAASAGPETGVVHVVERGESLWSIAADLGIDRDTRELVDRLQQANGGEDLTVGQRIIIPGELAELANAGQS